MLAFNVTAIPGLATNMTAEAAVTAPSVKEGKKTLYVGYNSYKIEFKSLVKSAIVSYKSSDIKIATVSKSGSVKPIKKGTATINVTVKQSSKTYNLKIIITVKTPAVTITQSTDLLNKGETYLYKAVVTGMTDKVAWSVSDTDVATISSNGALAAVKSGTVTVYAKAGGKTAKCKVTIAIKVLTAKEIYAKCGPATVEIVASDEHGESLGSGFFVEKGKVVTNYHVIKGASKIIVKTYNNKEYEITNILGYDETLDLAVLQLDIENVSLEISQESGAVGEDIYTLGSPFGLTGTMTDGMISTASRVIDEVDFIQINAAISPGNSGGPLVNIYGEVIGVNTMYYIDGQNLNFAINIKELKKVKTDQPISVADYFVFYEKKLEEEFKANILVEDPTISQYIDTCQYVAAGRGVQGTATSSESGDVYWFRVTEPGWFFGIVESENLTDLENTYFELYDYDANYLTVCREKPEELYQYIDWYLTPGDYLIYVYVPTNYYGADVNYFFALLYE